MIIKYFKFRDTGKIQLDKFPMSDKQDITFCCNDMAILVRDNFIQIVESDPPFAMFTWSKTVQTIRYCPNCGAKIVAQITR